MSKKISLGDFIRVLKSLGDSNRIIIFDVDKQDATYKSILSAIYDKIPSSYHVDYPEVRFLDGDVWGDFIIFDLEELFLPRPSNINEPFSRTKVLTGLIRRYQELCVEKDAKLMIITNNRFGGKNNFNNFFMFPAYLFMRKENNTITFIKSRIDNLTSSSLDARIFTRRAKLKQLHKKESI